MTSRDFRNIFQKLRKEKGITQDEMSKDLGVSKSTVAMWETGKRMPSPELYEQIADYFNVDIDYLYGRTEFRQRVHYDPDGNPQRTLSQEEEGLIGDFQKLNPRGKAEARKRVSELTKLEEYTRNLDESSFSETG